MLKKKNETKQVTLQQNITNNITIGDEQMIITGRAVTFDIINANGVQHFKSSYDNFDFTKPVSALLEHDRTIKIGKVYLHLKDDGIDFEMHLNKNKQAALDAWEDVKFGTTSAVSIGFNAKVSYLYDEDYELETINIIEASIYEVSLVDNPADGTADIDSIQSIEPEQKIEKKGEQTNMKNKDIFKQLRGEQTIQSPKDVANLVQTLKSELSETQSKAQDLNELLQNKEHTDSLKPEAFAELKQSTTDVSETAIKLQKQIEELELIQTQMEQERDDQINQILIDGKQSKSKSTKVMTQKAKNEFKQGLSNFINFKPEKKNFIQTNSNSTLSLTIPIVIASDIITEARKTNDNMWSRVKMGTQATGNEMEYILTTGAMMKTRGTYIDNIQPSESTIMTEKIKVQIGTLTTYITLDQMQINGTPDEVIKEFIDLCLEHLKVGIDADIYNYNGYDPLNKVYTGVQGMASNVAFQQGLTLESPYTEKPTLNDYIKNEAKKIGVFNYVWTSLEQFTDWAYETDANNVKMYEVKEVDGLPAIGNVKFIISEFIPTIDQAKLKTTPFAIAMVDPNNYTLTPPAGGEMFSVVDRPSPTNWRERERAFFVDAAGMLTKKGKTTAAYMPSAGA